jgi:spermidine synthase
MIGGAGYSVPRDFVRTYPDVKMDVAEIDAGMTAIARRFFRLKDDPRLTIYHQDGRMFLNQSSPEQYDGVFMDVAGSMFTIPYQLTTFEAVQHISRVLKPGGVAIFNLGSSIKGPGSRFLEAELATYRAVFPTVYLFKVNAQYPDERLQNVIIVASKSTRGDEPKAGDPLIAELLEHRYDGSLNPQPPLTDDLAPVEYYASIAQNYYLASR